jgi:DNA-binding transcriptional LysR family regulator
VTFPELQLFKEIAANRSMSKGAAHCGVSQSAASQHVQEVERRLGMDLFDRSQRPLGLTDAGKLYAEFCRDVLHRKEQFDLALEQMKNEVESAVRVASIYSVGLSEMGRLQEQFAERYPEASLQVDYMRPDRIYDAVRSGTADLGVVSYPEASREIAALPWRNEEMQLAAPPFHALANLEEVYPADLNGQDFVGFDEDLSIRKELERFFRTHGVAVNLVMHFDNIQMIKEAVALGRGVSILPARTMQAEIEQGRLVAVPLRAPELVRPVGIVHRRRKQLNRAAQGFLALVTGGAPGESGHVLR